MLLKAFLSLEKDFTKLAGEYYSQRKLKNVLDKIDKLSEQKELQSINHNVLETLDGNGVEVEISIFEGEKIIIERERLRQAFHSALYYDLKAELQTGEDSFNATLIKVSL